MNIESAVIKAICVLSFSLASKAYCTQGNVTMAIITCIAASVSVILLIREIRK